jgi:hypothetical protein
MSRILVISYSDLARDSRVDRQIGFLRRRHEVIAAGMGPPGYDDVQFIDLRPDAGVRADPVRRALLAGWLLVRRADAAYWAKPENRRALTRLERHGAELIIANDVPALPLAHRIARNAPVIFDAHEMATTEWSHIPWWRLILAPYVNALLRRYLPTVAGMTTVSPGIAEMYAQRYGIRPVVVTNASNPAALQPTPVHTPIRMICHSIADPQRQLELMIEAAGRVGNRFSFELMLVPTDAGYVRRLEQISAPYPWVTISSPQPQREIPRYCNDYDLGVYLLPPLNENALHALPNKLFEFIQARLGVVVGPSPEMAAVVREWDLGLVSDAFSAEALARALDSVTPERVATYKQRAHAAASELNSERNAKIVLDLVEQML